MRICLIFTAGMGSDCGKNKREHRAGIRILRPNSAIMLIDDHLTNRESQPTARPIAAPGVGSVFLEYMLQVFVRNGRTGVSYIYAIAVGGFSCVLPSFCAQRHVIAGAAPFPKKRIAADLDR